jgi:lipopolysaccharide/colanic/teichoic acid biosynthesis glycosyltransferase
MEDVPTGDVRAPRGSGAFQFIISAKERTPMPVALVPDSQGARASRVGQSLKRSFDLMGALLGLVLLLPIFLVVSIAIKVDSPGPVFFRQVRIGYRGRPFQIWKFRSMVVDAEEQKSKLLHLNIHRSDPRMFKAVGDPRVTRIGKLLRKYSFDELPQLINVLKGEMSLVGPRPLVPEEACHLTGRAIRQLDVRPGITGPWQVAGASLLPFSEMVRLNLEYVENWSLRRDLKLLAQSIPILVGYRPWGVQSAEVADLGGAQLNPYRCAWRALLGGHDGNGRGSHSSPGEM